MVLRRPTKETPRLISNAVLRQTAGAEGALLILIGSIFFSAMGLSVRALGQGVSANNLVFVRSLIQILIVLPWARTYFTGGLFKKARVHTLRGVGGIGSMFFLYLALQRLPLALAQLLAMTSVLWTAILSFIFLKERITLIEWLWGFIIISGAAVTLAGDSGGGWVVDGRGVLYALICGFMMGCALTALRSLRREVGTHEIIFYFGVMGVLLTVPGLMVVPSLPTTVPEVGLMLGVGVFASFGQIFMTAGFKYTTAFKATLCNLAQVCFNVLLGLWFLGEVPPKAFLGGALVMGLGILGLATHKQRRL